MATGSLFKPSSRSIKAVIPAVKRLVSRAWAAAKPGPVAVRGAGLGALVGAALLYLLLTFRSAEGPLLFGVGLAALFIVLGGLLAFLGQGIAKLLELFHRLPWPFRWMALAALVLLAISLVQFQMPGILVVMAYVYAVGMLLGGGIASLRRTRWVCLTNPQRAVTAAGIAAGAGLLAFGLYWYALYPGVPAKVIPDAGKGAAALPATLTLPDPSKPGPYPVKTLTYGAGTDRWRPEYGAQAAIKTKTVDAKGLLEGSWKGFTGQLRGLVWGVDPAHLPLNGRVWYPESSDPAQTFPLVLVVHGNHTGVDFSDPGYAYLGDLLASRGFIFVSVDENFINGLPTDFLENFSGENDARGWLLLEHLRQWREWNIDATSPFYHRVDMDNIAVMGHSRGGEAAAVAAMFNRLPLNPDNYGQVFPYNFNIKAVVAIAPIDGQYYPSGKATPLSNLNYFVLQGSHDSDLTSFDGINQYERVTFTPGADGEPGGWFKTALYMYRANHGQFNTVWGDDDKGLVKSGFLNKAALLPAEAQRQVAKVYISAFLEAALHNQRGYLPLFQDPRSAPHGWLPDTVYINRFDRAGDQVVANFEEDVNLQSTTLPGGAIQGLNFTDWHEQRLHSKWGDSETSAAYLAWNEGPVGGRASPVYTLTLPGQGLALAAQDALIFNLADALRDPPPGESAAKKAQQPSTRQPLDLTVSLEDDKGQTAELPLSRYRAVQPQIEVQLYKDNLFETQARSEPVLQSYALPLADFAQANPKFNPAKVTAVRFIFNKVPRGSLILDGVGFRPEQ